MLQVSNFSFSLQGVSILEKIDFAIAKGAYLSIIGPNGAGKSTLLKCLMRLHDRGRSGGEISVKGRGLSAYRQAELARVMAYVPQAGGGIPPFTVEELLRMSRYPYFTLGGSLTGKDIDAINSALSLTEMAALAKRPLNDLSGGERQKAFLAAALAQEAEIMLLDEPASFLDPKHAADLNRLLKMLNRERGLTMITVTHDLNHPLDVGGQALVLQQGQQLFFGDIEALLQQQVFEQAYQHKFTYVKHPLTGRPVVLTD